MTKLTKQTNAPPSYAILMVIQMRGCNAACITQCNMSRATQKATGRHHWATTHSVLPRRPPGQQETKQQQKCTNFLAIFDGHGGAPVQYRLHCPIEEVQGFTRIHWALPLGKYCGR